MQKRFAQIEKQATRRCARRSRGAPDRRARGGAGQLVGAQMMRGPAFRQARGDNGRQDRRRWSPVDFDRVREAAQRSGGMRVLGPPPFEPEAEHA
jgi:hypothetical protein